MNKILETGMFLKVYFRLASEQRFWIKKIKRKLKANLNIGKPLVYSWFREKKLGKYKLYYAINEETKKVVLITFSDKKKQAKTIRHIIENKEKYLEMLK